jgi:hypothetical protein
MKKENFEKVLQVFLGRRPFHPFSLELTNGTRLEVNHPETLELRTEMVICNSTTGIRSIFENEMVVRFITATGG